MPLFSAMPPQKIGAFAALMQNDSAANSRSFAAIPPNPAVADGDHASHGLNAHPLSEVSGGNS